MDISKWPLEQIMRLPDNLFGRRWPIVGSAEVTTGAIVYYLHPAGLPDRMVVWSAFAVGSGPTWAACHVGFKLAVNTVANMDEFKREKSLFTEIDGPYQGESELIVAAVGGPAQLFCRQGVVTNGRKLLLGLYNHATVSVYIEGGIVISGVPLSIPDSIGREYENR